MIHRHQITVRGFHCDLYGHVNNARYLEFLEEARWAYTETTPALEVLASRGQGFVVAAITIRYKRPLGPGTAIEVRTEAIDFTARRGLLHQEVIDLGRGKCAAEAEITFAIFDLASGRAVDITPEMCGWFAWTPPAETP